MGLPPPDPGSLSLSSTEFVEHHRKFPEFVTESVEKFSAYTQEVNLNVS